MKYVEYNLYIPSSLNFRLKIPYPLFWCFNFALVMLGLGGPTKESNSSNTLNFQFCDPKLNDNFSLTHLDIFQPKKNLVSQLVSQSNSHQNLEIANFNYWPSCLQAIRPSCLSSIIYVTTSQSVLYQMKRSPGSIWIVKPPGEMCGNGIRLVMDPKESKNFIKRKLVSKLISSVSRYSIHVLSELAHSLLN